MKAWHFTDGERLRDGQPLPPVGEWLHHEGECVMCCSGLHASRRLIDALRYAPGAYLHRVEVRGIVDQHSDKLLCRARRRIWSIDATDVLRVFARRCALDVVHLWSPAAVVLRYLNTGDELLRDAAQAAAWDAAEAAAGAAAWAAARTAAWAAADVAWDAAEAAADVAWDAAEAAAATAQNRRLTAMVSAEHRRQQRS